MMNTKLLSILAVAILSFSAYAQQIPTAGLVGHYDFNNGALTDNISGANFTKTGTASTSITDRFGNTNGAISLNGDDLTRPDIDFDINNTNPYLPRTISFWLKTVTNDSNTRIIYNDNTQTSLTDTDFIGLTVYLQNGKINAQNRVGTHGNLFTHPQNISDGNWHHVVIQGYSTHNASLKAFLTFIHVDGVKIGASGYNNSGNINPKVNEHIGNVSFSRLKATSLPTNDKYQDGIDEILFYTRILTDAEIVTLAANNGGGSSSGTVYYVNPNSTGNNDGTSWANAYTNLQDALTNLTTNSDELWVASGTYKPHATDRDASFVINNNIYGGFAGTEANLSDRDISLIHSTNATILSGDLLGDDDAIVDFNDTTRDDNSKHVVEISSNGLKINGLTIKDGYADGTTGDDRFGGGIFKSTAVTVTTIKNCIIKNNVASAGAGLTLTTTAASNITIDACIIENNLANTAAGLDFHISGTNTSISISITNSLFKDNKTNDDVLKSRKGTGASAARLRAYYTGVTLNADLINNTFANNISLGTSTTFTDYPTINLTTNDGNFGDVTIANNIFWGNKTSGNTITRSIGRTSSAEDLFTTNSTQRIINNIDEESFFNISGSTGTIASNPNFNSNFELTSGSPAIDSGINAELPNGSYLDLAGNDRVFNTTVDRGAYEFGSSAPLSVDNFFIEDELSIYPNPTSLVLNIKINKEVKHVQVYNLQGQRVKTATNKSINVSNLSDGMYLVRITTLDNNIKTKKFIKN